MKLALNIDNVRTGAGIQNYYGKEYSVFFEFPPEVRLGEVNGGAILKNHGGGIWEVPMSAIVKRPEGFLLQKSQQMLVLQAPDTPGKLISFKTWIGFPGDAKRYWIKDYKLNIMEAIKPREKKTPFSLNTDVFRTIC